MNKPVSPALLQNAQPADAEFGAAGSGNVAALERGISVLRCFDDNTLGLSNQQLSQRTGIPKPTLTRLTATLVNLGLLKQDETSDRFTLGPGIMPIARAFLSTLDFRACARPLMQEFAERNDGGSVLLAIHDETSDPLNMVIVEACRARRSMVAARIEVGSRTPVINSALGRAFLLLCEPSERERILREIRTREPLQWQQHEAGLMRSLRLGEQDGYCMSLGEWHREINSVSIAFRNAEGQILSMNSGGPTYVFPEERLRWDIAPKLHELASRIASQIGGFPPLPLQRND